MKLLQPWFVVSTVLRAGYVRADRPGARKLMRHCHGPPTIAAFAILLAACGASPASLTTDKEQSASISSHLRDVAIERMNNPYTGHNLTAYNTATLGYPRKTPRNWQGRVASCVAGLVERAPLDVSDALQSYRIVYSGAASQLTATQRQEVRALSFQIDTATIACIGQLVSAAEQQTWPRNCPVASGRETHC